MKRPVKKKASLSPTTPARSWALAAIALLCLIGVGISVELTRIHYRTHTDPRFNSVCAVNESVNCETVAQSPYSLFLDVPLSVWGLLGYAGLAVLALWGLARRRLHPDWPRGGILAVSVSFAGVSALLATISITRIDSLCLFCLATYVINGLLLVLASLAATSTEAGPLRAVLRDLKTAVARPLGPAILFVAALAVAGGLLAFYPNYWHHVGWSDLPSLPSGTTEDGLHWIGATHPKLVIEEFSDYECPHCRRAHKHVRSLAAQYPDGARLIHRHFPLDSACNPKIPSPFHARACEFAIAAECAGEQGRFWDMNDALFSIQDTVKAADVDVQRLCIQLGLDASRFKECVSGGRVKARLARDVKDGGDREIQGTPTFFVDGHPFTGSVPEAIFETRLKQAPTVRDDR